VIRDRPNRLPRASTADSGDDVRVVAAFQMPSHVLKEKPWWLTRYRCLVWQDDPKAAEEVITLAEAIGMRGYYAGGLDNAVVVEGLTALLISINKHYNVKTASIGVTGLEFLD
jgi:predicted dinucleotide-binding enzyme